jgi:hypothetical protein
VKLPQLCVVLVLLAGVTSVLKRLCLQLASDDWAYSGYKGPAYYGGTTQVRHQF